MRYAARYHGPGTSGSSELRHQEEPGCALGFSGTFFERTAQVWVDHPSGDIIEGRHSKVTM